MNSGRDESQAERRAAASEGVVPEAAADGEKIPVETRSNPGASIPVWILALIAVVAALYLGRAFFVPLLLGILVSYALRPIVDRFERYHIPRALGAALILAVLVGGGSWMTFSWSDEATAIIESLPDAARKLRQNLSLLRTGSSSALRRVQEAADEIEGAAVDAGLKSTAAPVVVTRESEANAWLRDFMLAQSALLVALIAQAPMVLLLTYFLLASGTHFRRKLVQVVGSSLTRKKDIVRMLEEVDEQVQRYLLVMLTSNALVGILTWLAFEMLGVEHAGVWGAAAGVLHFVPYLGTVVIALASGVSGLLQFGSLPPALAVAGLSVLVSGTVGMVFTTWLQGKFARVNAAVLFIVLLFFGWLWGMAGLLLGAPLLAIVKVVCDRVERLKPLGELLGR
jgi:predicted PurR-regulated permease PerM